MSEAFLQEVDQLVRARYPVLYVVTWEEDRARRLLAMVATKQQKPLLEWSVTDGLRLIASPKQSAESTPKRQRDALAMLNEILQNEQPAIYMLKDFHVYLETPEIVRQLRDLSLALRSSIPASRTRRSRGSSASASTQASAMPSSARPRA